MGKKSKSPRASKRLRSGKTKRSGKIRASIPAAREFNLSEAAMRIHGAVAGSAHAPTKTQVQRERGLRFLLQTSQDTTSAQLASRLQEATSLPFRVERLFPRIDKKSDVNNMHRMFLAVLPSVSEVDLATSAFDIAYQVRDRLPDLIARVEPDLPQSIYEPHHDPANAV